MDKRSQEEPAGDRRSLGAPRVPRLPWLILAPPGRAQGPAEPSWNLANCTAWILIPLRLQCNKTKSWEEPGGARGARRSQEKPGGAKESFT